MPNKDVMMHVSLKQSIMPTKSYEAVVANLPYKMVKIMPIDAPRCFLKAILHYKA